jgi:hypothetical protein
MTVNRTRHNADTVLDQVETRNRVWNPDTLEWIAQSIAEPLGTVGIQGYRSSDATYQPARLDKATNTLQTIEYEHHEIHAGSHFFYTDSVTLASSGTQVYLLTTPDTTKWSHLVFMATGSAITKVDLYEGANRTGTTEQTLLNSDRNSLTAATLIVHKDISGGTTDGALIWTMQSGTATAQSRSGLTANRESEIILKQNTKYLLRITSSTASNLTNLQLEWYEHTNIV